VERPKLPQNRITVIVCTTLSREVTFENFVQIWLQMIVCGRSGRANFRRLLTWKKQRNPRTRAGEVRDKIAHEKEREKAQESTKKSG